MNMLKSLDLFGVNFQFLLYGNKYHRSKFGGMLSIIYISLCTLVLFYYLYMMFNKNKFKINSYVSSVMIDEISYLKTPNFFLGIYIEPLNDFKISNYIYLKIINGKEIINSSDCSNLITRKMLNDDDEYNNYLDNSFCFNGNYSIQGSVESTSNSSLRVIYGVNTTKLNEDLKLYNVQYDSIKNKSISFELLYTVGLFDMKIDTSIEYIISKYYLSPIIIDNSCNEYLVFSKLTFNIDKDFFRTNYETIDIYDFNGGQTACQISKSKEIVKNEINISIDKKKYVFYIDFMKFQEMLNNVNSITNFLSLFFFYIGCSYNLEHLNDLIIKNSFIFKDYKDINIDQIVENKKETFISSQTLKIQKNNSLNNENKMNEKFNENFVSITENNNSNLSAFNLKERKKYYKNLKKQIINVKYFNDYPHFIKKFFEKIFTKKNFSIFEVAEKKYETLIDVSNILLKFNQIDLIIHSLFSQEQIKIFKYIKLTSEIEEEISYAETISFFKNRLKQKKIDKIDYFLLNSLSQDDIKEFYPILNHNNLELEQL